MTHTAGSTARLFVLPVIVAAGLALLYFYISTTPARLGDDQILNAPFLEGRLIQHVALVAVSFVIAAAIALPLGILLAHGGHVFRPIVFGLASLGQIVPSIAVLALAFTFIGLGFRPTVLALVVY